MGERNGANIIIIKIESNCCNISLWLSMAVCILVFRWRYMAVDLVAVA